MEFSAKKTNQANAVIKAKISKEVLTQRIDKIAASRAKKIKVDGFRIGKTPVAIVKQRFAGKLLEDAKSECIKELLDSALVQLGLKNEDLTGEPFFDKFEEKEDGISLSIKTGFKPSIDLKDYKSVVPEIKIEEITNKDIEESIKEMAQRFLEPKPSEKTTLENGDIADIDFEGFIDGKPFEGSKAQNFKLTLGSKSFIENFEAQLEGKKVGEEIEVNVNFLKEYGVSHLAGKTALFQVRINGIFQTAEPELNDELAKKILLQDKEATLEKLQAQQKKQLASQKKYEAYNSGVKISFIEQLIASVSFDLPEQIVEQEMDLLANQKASKMNEEEVEKLKGNQEEIQKLRESCKEEAQKSVQATFIIDELASREDVKVSKEEVMQAIYTEAYQTRQDPKQLLETYKNNGYLSVINMALVKDKVLTKIFDEKLGL